MLFPRFRPRFASPDSRPSDEAAFKIAFLSRRYTLPQASYSLRRLFSKVTAHSFAAAPFQTEPAAPGLGLAENIQIFRASQLNRSCFSIKIFEKRDLLCLESLAISMISRFFDIQIERDRRRWESPKPLLQAVPKYAPQRPKARVLQFSIFIFFR